MTSNGSFFRAIVAPLAVALVSISAPTSADIVHLDDVIIKYSLCVGNDCADGEAFGFDTIRLKENNLRIRALDTSNSSSFPTNDWQLTFNDSTNGGANKFSIDDIDGARTPFTIEASAPSHSIFVDDGGRVGFGTSTPVTDLHVKTGNTPTLRLEQDGSSGFTPQTWDVSGNETNFFIRDATNGSTLPFRIIPGAPSNSLYVDSGGRVGLGTTSPRAMLDVLPSGSADLPPSVTAALNVDDGPLPAGVTIPNHVALNVIGNDAIPDYVALNVVGDAIISGNVSLGSSRAMKDDLVPADGNSLLSLLSELPIHTWRYRSEPNEVRHIGPMAEDFHRTFGFSSDPHHLSIVDANGLALAAIKELRSQLEARDREIAALIKRLAALEERLEP